MVEVQIGLHCTALRPPSAEIGAADKPGVGNWYWKEQDYRPRTAGGLTYAGQFLGHDYSEVILLLKGVTLKSSTLFPQLLDLCILDVNSLDFQYRTLAAAALCHYTSIDVVKKASGKKLLEVFILLGCGFWSLVI